MRYKVKVSTSEAMAYEPNDTVNSTGRAKNTQAHTHLLQQSNKKKKKKKKTETSTKRTLESSMYPY